MSASAFQFSEPKMREVTFTVNDAFIAARNEVEINTNIENRQEYADNGSEAMVQMRIEIGEKEGASPFYLSIVYQSEFRWKPDTFNKEQIDTFLQKNAVLLLLSYARPAIAAITNFSKFPSYNIPYIDLTN